MSPLVTAGSMLDCVVPLAPFIKLQASWSLTYSQGRVQDLAYRRHPANVGSLNKEVNECLYE